MIVPFIASHHIALVTLVLLSLLLLLLLLSLPMPLTAGSRG